MKILEKIKSWLTPNKKNIIKIKTRMTYADFNRLSPTIVPDAHSINYKEFKKYPGILVLVHNDCTERYVAVLDKSSGVDRCRGCGFMSTSYSYDIYPCTYKCSVWATGSSYPPCIYFNRAGLDLRVKFVSEESLLEEL